MEKDLEQRTKQFSLAVIRFTSLPSRNRAADVLGRQLLRFATSIGANYREANRGVSRADFANKIGTVQKEASETQCWLELLIESDIGKRELSLSTKKLWNCWRSSLQSARSSKNSFLL